MCISSCFSQFKATGYFDKEIGISYAFSDKFQTEVRVFDDLNSEFNSKVSIFYRFISNKNYNLNTGFGISIYPFHSEFVDPFESFYIPLQLEITPLKTIKNIALILEMSYHNSTYNNDSGIRNNVGIRYIFN